jgi:hypothetical protein
MWSGRPRPPNYFAVAQRRGTACGAGAPACQPIFAVAQRRGTACGAGAPACQPIFAVAQHGEPHVGRAPPPAKLFAAVLTARDTIFVATGQDECSTPFVIPSPLPSTLSFRIRFSGEESAFPKSWIKKGGWPTFRGFRNVGYHRLQFFGFRHLHPTAPFATADSSPLKRIRNDKDNGTGPRSLSLPVLERQGGHVHPSLRFC